MTSRGATTTVRVPKSVTLSLENTGILALYSPSRRTLTARSREVLKPWDSGWDFSHRSEIWQAPRQRCLSNLKFGLYFPQNDDQWSMLAINSVRPPGHIHFTWQWRHNGHDGVSNHQPDHYLLNRSFRRRSKKTSKLRVTGLCAGNSPVTGVFPTQMSSNVENVSIWWRHHGFENRVLYMVSYRDIVVIYLSRLSVVSCDSKYHSCTVDEKIDHTVTSTYRIPLHMMSRETIVHLLDADIITTCFEKSITWQTDPYKTTCNIKQDAYGYVFNPVIIYSGAVIHMLLCRLVTFMALINNIIPWKYNWGCWCRYMFSGDVAPNNTTWNRLMNDIYSMETYYFRTMMTSSNGHIHRVTGHWWGFPAQKPVTRSFDVLFGLRLNKRLSKQSWGWWFETPSCPLLSHSNAKGRQNQSNVLGI